MRINCSAVGLSLLLSIAALPALAIEPQASEGTLQKIDRAAKTIVVKTADGAEHTFQFTTRLAVHGARETGDAAQASWHGLKEGSHVVVHYTAKGTVSTAHEVDRIGEDGLKASEGTVKEIDRGGKKMTIKAADGTEQTFQLADRASRDAGKNIEKGTEKSARVTVYYTEEAGHRVAHFFKTAQSSGIGQ